MEQEKLEQLKMFFSNDRFAMKTVGIEIEDIDDFYAKCSLKVDDRHKNANEQVMGGAIFTLADFTFAVASNHNGEIVVTSNSSITYLSPLKKGNKLISESRLIKNGKTAATYEISIKDEFENPIAVVVTTGLKLK